MADISITASNVVPATDASTEVILLGADADAGDILVYDSTDGDWVLAANSSAALAGNGDPLQLRMATSSGVAGQSVSAVRPGSKVTVGSVLTKGRWYVLSTGGAISPESDATTNDWSTLIGYAVSATQLSFQPIVTGVQV
jgi:hypothetical protein